MTLNLSRKEKGYAPERNVTVLDGKGACPPEDSNGLEEKGNRSYRDLLDKYQRSSKACAGAIRDIERSAINYAPALDGGFDALSSARLRHRFPPGWWTSRTRQDGGRAELHQTQVHGT